MHRTACDPSPRMVEVDAALLCHACPERRDFSKKLSHLQPNLAMSAAPPAHNEWQADCLPTIASSPKCSPIHRCHELHANQASELTSRRWPRLPSKAPRGVAFSQLMRPFNYRLFTLPLVSGYTFVN